MARVYSKTSKDPAAMGDLECQVCHRRVDASRLTLRDLSGLYSGIASVADGLEDMHMWLCGFCCVRVSQCTHFIMTVQRSKDLLSAKSSSESMNLYSFVEHRLPNINICQIDGCPTITDELEAEEDKSNEPLMQIKQESGDIEIKTEIKFEKEFEVEFVNTANSKVRSLSKVVTNSQTQKFGKNETNKNDQEYGEEARPDTLYTDTLQLHWSELLSAQGESIQHLGVERVYFTEQQVIEEIKRRKESPRYRYAKYRCEDCAYYNIKKEYYMKHRDSKHSKVECKHECSMCHYRFRTSSELEEHRSQHLRKWRCVRCDVILSKNMWPRHGTNCLSTAQCKCDICGKIFANNFSMRLHYVRAHVKTKPKTKQHECTVCSKKYTYESQLDIHMRTHTGENPFECNQCEMKFISNHNLGMHIRQMHVEYPTEKVYCVQCDRYFRSPEELDKHMTSTVAHVGETKYKLECDTCHRKFPSLRSLETHITVHHIGTKDYHCPVCNKAFSTERYMKDHMKRHNKEKPPRNHVCDLCGAAFWGKFLLKSHMTAIHYKLRPYECNVCGAKFGYKSALYTHNKLKHEGKKRRKKSDTRTFV